MKAAKRDKIPIKIKYICVGINHKTHRKIKKAKLSFSKIIRLALEKQADRL